MDHVPLETLRNPMTSGTVERPDQQNDIPRISLDSTEYGTNRGEDEEDTLKRKVES